jgi:hypothetical protein
MLLHVNQVQEIAVEMGTVRTAKHRAKHPHMPTVEWQNLKKQDVLAENAMQRTEQQTTRLGKMMGKLGTLVKIESCGLERIILYIVLTLVLVAFAIGIWRLVVTRE